MSTSPSRGTPCLPTDEALAAEHGRYNPMSFREKTTNHEGEAENPFLGQKVGRKGPSSRNLCAMDKPERHNWPKLRERVLLLAISTRSLNHKDGVF